jgi:hypothetical protein
MVIGISGYAGSGKDTTGELLRYLFAKESRPFCPQGEFKPGIKYVTSGWKIKKFANPLRKVAAILTGLPLEYLYTNEFKQAYLPKEWSQLIPHSIRGMRTDEFELKEMTGREFLQRLGTDAIRNNIHENAWVIATMASYRPINPELRASMGNVIDYSACKWPDWIITDVRFPNELAAIKKVGGLTIRINRYPEFSDQNLFDAWRKRLHTSETALDNATFDIVIDNGGSLKDLENKLTSLFLPKIKEHEQE